jgi:hypothetical protein
MVFLKDDPQASFGHVVIVDGIEGEQVRIRDPWPLASRSAYEVGLSDFEEAWLISTDDLRSVGQAVVLE